MGRTEGGAARPNTDSGSQWVEYFTRWLDQRGFSNAELARATGLGDSAISKWRRGTSVPDVESCRRIANAIKRPVLEVLVAAGHLEADEARVRPETPREPTEDEARLQRLQRVMDNPETPATVRERLRMLLDVADDIGRAADKRA